MPVALRETPQQADFALRAWGHLLPVFIAQGHRDPGKRRADGRVVVGLIHIEGRDRAERLAQAIAVADHIRPAVHTAEPFAAGQDALHPPAPPVQAEKLRRKEGDVERVLVKIPCQAADIPAGALAEDVYRPAVCEHAEILREEHHEGHRRGRAEVQLLQTGDHLPVALGRRLHSAARMQNALGLPGRTGGVDHEPRGVLRRGNRRKRREVLEIFQKALV